MDRAWIHEEEQLWRQVMNPRRRKISLHGVPPGPWRKSLLKEMDRDREKEFAAQWRAYGAWIQH